MCIFIIQFKLSPVETASVFRAIGSGSQFFYENVHFLKYISFSFNPTFTTDTQLHFWRNKLSENIYFHYARAIHSLVMTKKPDEGCEVINFRDVTQNGPVHDA